MTSQELFLARKSCIEAVHCYESGTLLWVHCYGQCTGLANKKYPPSYNLLPLTNQRFKLIL